MKVPSILEMLQSGVHFGHQKGKWHPKMKPYIFVTRNNLHIINVEKTAQALEEAGNKVEEIVKNGGSILFVATKKQAVKIVKEMAEKCSMPYINDRWLGGLFTNFPVVQNVIKKYNDLRKQKESGELSKYTKKEQLEIEREIINLAKYVDGLSTMEKLPQAVFVIDARKEKTAIAEANRKKIPVIAMCDTNTSPKGIDYIIPANDDATKSITLITQYLVDRVNAGKAQQGK